MLELTHQISSRKAHMVRESQLRLQASALEQMHQTSFRKAHMVREPQSRQQLYQAFLRKAHTVGMAD